MVKIANKWREVKAGGAIGSRTILGAVFWLPSGGYRRPHAVARCRCGAVSVVNCRDLVRRRNQSCERCRFHVEHGDTCDNRQTHLYRVWVGMRRRCYDSTRRDYRYYGGRGIAVCGVWLNGYASFRQWAIASGYRRGLEIDRIDNDGDYGPTNCRWVTRKQNNRNTSRSKMVSAFGETKCLSEWIEDDRCTANYRTVYQRLVTRGWDAERAISAPARKFAFSART